MSANLTGRKRGEAYLDLEGQAEKRMVELQTPTRRREVDATLSNPAAEAAVIAGLVRCGDPAAIGRYALEHRLDSECFTIPAFRAAYAAITDLAAAGEPVDVPILAQRMAHEDLAAVDSACREHVSAANFGSYARILIECKQRRAEATARDRLAQAIESSAPHHELATLFEAVRSASAGQDHSGKDPDQFNAADLFDMEFPAPTWILPDVLPETGLFLLCGKPKAGKSWLSLGIAMALAQGGEYLGRDVPRKRVLYLALEDTPRRLNARMRQLHFGTGSDLRGLDVRISAPKVGDGLEQQLRDAARNGFQVIILDTLQKVRPPAGKRGSQYADDYETLSAIKRVADECGICILVVHHLRKMESEDPQDDISGTNGLAGAADGSIVLRRMRGKPQAILHVLGSRDLPEAEIGLRFEDGLWQFAGTAAEVRTTGEQSEILDALRAFGDEGATVNQLVSATGRKAGALRHHLRKMNEAGAVRFRNTKPAPHYALPLHVDAVDNPTHHARENPTRESGVRESVCGFENTVDTVDTVDTIDTIDTVDTHSQTPRPVNGVNASHTTVDTTKTLSDSGLTANPVNGVNAVNVQRPTVDTPKSLSRSGLTGNAVNGVNGVNQINVDTQKTKGNGGGHVGAKLADADALAAKGRRLLEESKSAPSGVQILPNGEIVEDPAPGSRVDLRNRGNRLLEQARALRLSQAEKRERPPEEPDILVDNQDTSPAETPIETATLANQQADIASANQPPPAKPLKRPENPPVCLPAPNYPFRYLTKCDRPTPIYAEGSGDPIGCSNCGAVFSEGVAS